MYESKQQNIYTSYRNDYIFRNLGEINAKNNPEKTTLYITVCIFFTLLKSWSFLSVESILSEKKEKERKNMKMFIHVQGNLSQHTRYLHILLCVM